MNGPGSKRSTAEDQKTLLTDTLTELLRRDEQRPAGRDRHRDRRPRQRQFRPVGRPGPRGGPAAVPIHVYGIGGSAAGFLQLKDAADPGHAVRRRHGHRPVPLAGPGHQGRRGRAESDARRQGGRDASASRCKEGKDVTEIALVHTGQGGRVGRQEGDRRLGEGGPRQRDARRPVRQDGAGGRPQGEDALRREQPAVGVQVHAAGVPPRPPRRPDVPRSSTATARRWSPARRSSPTSRTTRKDLFAYDLLVIGDVDANYFTGEQRNWIKDFVTEGGGLVVIAGRLHAPATLARHPAGRRAAGRGAVGQVPARRRPPAGRVQAGAQRPRQPQPDPEPRPTTRPRARAPGRNCPASTGTTR